MGVGGWLDSDFAFRFAVSVPHTVSPSASNDVNVVIPKNHPIWAVLAGEASQDSIRVTEGDGYTPLVFQLTDAAFSGAWSTANKDGGIQIEDAKFLASTAVKLLWVYYGNSTATSGAGSFTASTPLTGYVYSSLPSDPSGYVRALPQAPGATVARPRVSIASTESRRFWLDLTGLLTRRDGSRLVEGSIGSDSVWGVVASAATGGNPASVDDSTKTRFVETRDGRLLASVYASGAADGTDYVYTATVYTAPDTSAVANGADQILAASFMVRCNDVAEA